MMDGRRLSATSITDNPVRNVQENLTDWQTQCTSVSQRCKHLLGTGQWSDCKFIVGIEPHQEVLEGHKLLLAIASPVFQAMFYGGIPEKNNPIPILDVQPEAFKALLEYIYTDNITLTSFDQACELCYGAKKYMLPHLVEECTKYLWSDLQSKNACRAYEFAKLFEEPKLMEKCLLIMQQQTLNVLRDQSFEEVEIDTILTIFDMDSLAIESEMCLFNALTRYVNKQNSCSNGNAKVPRLDGSFIAETNEEEASTSSGRRTPNIRDCLMKIRFLTMTPKQFAEGPGNSNLLTQSEKLAIFMHISSPSVDHQMPPGFSKNRTPRSGLVQAMSSDECDEPVLKFYCTLTLIRRESIVNSCILECYLTFTSDRNIWMYGVQVPSQISSSIDRTYSELLYAHLLDANESRLTYTHYTGRVPYHSVIDITFDKPVPVQRNKIYKVGLVLHKAGSYMGASYQNHSTCNDVVFTFGNMAPPTPGSNTCLGLVRTIIFSTSPPLPPKNQDNNLPL